MHIRAQNAALIVRRLATADLVQFEVFEVLPLIRAVMETEGKLLRSYPGPAIQIPADIFTDGQFIRDLSYFLVQMDFDRLRHPPSSYATDRNVHDTVHPGYISELLLGILGGYGQPAVVDRITKRIGDEVLLDPDKQSQQQGDPWRRSPLWLTLRVSLQSSLLSNSLYKHFILFFHAHLLRTCVRRHLPSELLYVMRVKMARRLSKLQPAHSHYVYQFVHDTAKRTEALLSKRWTEFQDIGSLRVRPALQLKGLDFVKDSQISLDNSYKYLTKVLRSASPGVTHDQFTPSNAPRLYNVQNLTFFANGGLERAITKDPRIAIADFELFVERNLESWIASSRNNDNSVDVIASCIEQYLAGAKGLYGTNFEDISVMILTIMDLWMALDRFAIRGCPLLKEYSPEIPWNFLHCLLLHRSPNLKRALHIEGYLSWRHKEALDVPSIFSNSVGDSSFAVKYFRTSGDHQHLYDEIISHAQLERVAKREEHTLLKQELGTFFCLGDMGYEYVGINRKTWEDSQKRIEEKPKKIRVHEWPLPPSMVHAQLAVFELSPPHTFSVWRDITYTILNDIGPPSASSPLSHPPLLLDSFSGLQRWAVRHQRRVTIASTTPSFSDQMVDISAEESLILTNNPLSFRLFDRVHNSWVIESFSDSSPTKLRVPPTPKSSPYIHLDHFVYGTEHTPNDVVTAQAHCPPEINLHEFIAFSGLRSGPRLQWLNIARELASPFLTFSREEVHTLITQAAWQLGPLWNGVREWHLDLGIFSFGNALLCEMECLLLKIKSNWQEEVTVRTIGVSGSLYLHLCLIWP
jgi:hypothetical protein